MEMFESLGLPDFKVVFFNRSLFLELFHITESYYGCHFQLEIVLLGMHTLANSIKIFELASLTVP